MATNAGFQLEGQGKEASNPDNICHSADSPAETGTQLSDIDLNNDNFTNTKIDEKNTEGELNGDCEEPR